MQQDILSGQPYDCPLFYICLSYPHDLVIEQNKPAHDLSVVVVVSEEPISKGKPLRQVFKIHSQLIRLRKSAHQL